MRRRRLGAAGQTLQPGGYILGVGGSQTGTMPAPFTTPGGVVSVQPGIGSAVNVIAPSVTGYGSTGAPTTPAASTPWYEWMLIGLGILAAIVIIPNLEKR